MEAFATESFSLSPALKDFISGAVAGAFAITIAQPLDTVRVRLQQGALTDGPKRNTLNVLIGMIRHEGLLSPLKGLTYPLMFASVQGAILFQAYGWTLRQLASAQQPERPAAQSPRPAQACRTGPRSASTSRSSLTPTPTSAATVVSAVPESGSAGTSVLLKSGSNGVPAPVPTSLHELHLHHHHQHHYLYEQHTAAVHGPSSVSGRILSWMVGRTGLPGGTTTVARVQSAGTGAEPADSSGGAGSRSAASSCHKASTLESRDVSCSASSLLISSSSGSGSDDGSRRDGSGGARCGSTVEAANVCQEQGEGSSQARSSNSCIHRCSSSSIIISSGDDAGGGGEETRQGWTQGMAAAAEQQPLPAPLPTPWHGFVAGGVAGLAQVFLWSPVELLKLRAQLQTTTPGSAGYRNPAALAVQVLRQDGVAGLYRGFTLTVVRDVPSFALYFWLYHDIAGALSPGVHPEQAPPATQVLAGGAAGVLAWLPIYPLDTLKTRVQAVTTSSSRGKTWLHFAKEMHREAGARAFYRGMAPTLVRAFMMDGASFLGYTTTLKLLGG